MLFLFSLTLSRLYGTIGAGMVDCAHGGGNETDSHSAMCTLPLTATIQIY